MQNGWQQTGVRREGEFIGGEVCEFLVADIEYGNGEALVVIDTTYNCDFGNQLTPTPVIEPTEPTRRSSGGSSGTRTLRSVLPTPTVLGAATSTQSFCPFLEDYMQIGIQNDSWEVTKLQMFLSIVMRYQNPVTGIFDAVTDANVKLFQERYRSEILDPWYERGIVPHNRPTGFVYKTTRWKINDIICPGYEAYPSFDGEDLRTNINLDGQ
jgi:peptidoglycan hydrolase-like protein with peptidoglycan-binding domain